MTKPAIHVQLEAHANGIHVQQVYTGFNLLEQQGYLTCHVSYERDRILRCKKLGYRSSYNRCVIARMNEKTICYDLNDNPYIVEEFLDISDYYFKRSYSDDIVRQYADRKCKIFPFGFNYLVYTDGWDWNGLIRSFRLSSIRTGLRSGMNYIPAFDFFNDVPRVSSLRQAPPPAVTPRVLFMARLWEPRETAEQQAHGLSDRQSLNEVRIACMHEMKREFGDRFFGGIADSAYARKMCPELVISDKKITSQAHYLSLVKSFPICVATMGLMRSNGYKLAEYIAFSRAIVSEPIQYEVPGNFQEGKNYLEFTSPDACVQKVGELFESKDKIMAMMRHNWNYYNNFVAPDQIIKNTLQVILTPTL